MVLFPSEDDPTFFIALYLQNFRATYNIYLYLRDHVRKYYTWGSPPNPIAFLTRTAWKELVDQKENLENNYNCSLTEAFNDHEFATLHQTWALGLDAKINPYKADEIIFADYCWRITKAVLDRAQRRPLTATIEPDLLPFGNYRERHFPPLSCSGKLPSTPTGSDRKIVNLYTRQKGESEKCCGNLMRV